MLPSEERFLAPSKHCLGKNAGQPATQSLLYSDESFWVYYTAEKGWAQS